MSNKIWFYEHKGEQKGPAHIAEIDMLVAAKVIGPDTLVWREGMKDWQPAAAALPETSIPNDWPDMPPPMPAEQPQSPATAAAGATHDGFDAEPKHHPTEFMECVKYCFNHYSRFRGRARRPEYWYFVLFNFLVGLALGFIDGMLFGFANDVSIFNSLYSLAILVPSIAVGARRLHDIGRSGWWQLLWFIPIIGWIIMIIWLASRGEDGANEYGPA
jgi:uncharacterized membrane protein YhaH (DUF805 family)